MNVDTYFESDSVMNYYDLHVKEEEDCSVPNVAECLAMTLGKDISMIEWVLHNDPIKMMQYIEKAKRTIRREKARLQTRMRQVSNPVCVSKIEVKEEVPEPMEAPKKRGKKAKALFQSDTQSTSDETTQKKMVQMIRNRISAQISRDKKKVYLQDLEGKLQENEDTNDRLKLQLHELQRQSELMQQENRLLKKSLKITKTSKKMPNEKQQIGLQLMMLASQYMQDLPFGAERQLFAETVSNLQDRITIS